MIRGRWEARSGASMWRSTRRCRVSARMRPGAGIVRGGCALRGDGRLVSRPSIGRSSDPADSNVAGERLLGEGAVLGTTPVDEVHGSQLTHVSTILGGGRSTGCDVGKGRVQC